jgi:hypothetical protein
MTRDGCVCVHGRGEEGGREGEREGGSARSYTVEGTIVRSHTLNQILQATPINFIAEIVNIERC